MLLLKYVRKEFSRMFDNKKVRISTIITFYNGQISLLKELIESIEVSIDRLIQIQKQNLIEHNLVIINDSINKAVEGILEVFIDDYRSKSFSNIVLIHNSMNLGIIGSRLKGLKYIGESDIVHIIDQDDKIDNNFYSIANKIFHENKEVNFLVSGTAIIIDENNKQISKFILPESLNRIGNKNILKKFIYGTNFVISMGSLVFRGILVDQIIALFEKFDRDIDGSDDALVQIFLLKSGYKCIFSEELVLFYRMHNNNYSKEISKDFYSKTLKGLKILNQIGLITDKELEFRRRIDRSLRILRKGFKNWKIIDWKNLMSDLPLLIKFFYYSRIYKPSKKYVPRSKTVGRKNKA